MGQLLNERITDIVYHFCDLDAAFYLVYRDALYLTNVIDTVRDKRFNSGKLYYMCFARHFNSNMGYPGKKDYLNVRIEFNGELLSQRYKGVQVNSIPMNNDLVVNREQEDRLVTNVPVIQDAHQYITGIYICDPDIANESLINPKTGQPLDDVTEDRKKILYMMQKPQFYGKVYVFNDYNSFNNLGNFRNIREAIKNGKVVTPNVIRRLAVSAYKVDDVYTFDAKTITTIGFIYAIMQYGESKSIKSFFHSNGVKKVDKIWNKQIPLFKKRAQEITNGFAMKMTSIYDRDLSDSKELDKVKAMMRSSLFEGRIGSRLRLSLPGKMRVFYPYVMNALYGYMSAVNCKEFTTLISRKMKLACERYGIPYSSRLDSLEDTLPIAVGENINIKKLKLIIENLIDELK